MKNEIKHIWSIVCRKGLIENDTNVISLMEIFEKVDVNLKENIKFGEDKSVIVPFDFEVVSFWKRQLHANVAKGEAKLNILSPKGKRLGGALVNFEIPALKSSARTIAKINGFPITGSGEYTIEIQEKIGDQYITVTQIPLEVIVHENSKK
ncbi:MAG: hypothetical protein Q8K02_15585 [Flavobacterium sp.]|nr:hypothetical protein [Flavobacterium sp.]